MTVVRNAFLQTAEDGGVCRVTRIRSPKAERDQPVVLLPGMFTSRRFWLSDKDIGLAAYLAEQGFDSWIIERRGIGDVDPQARAGADEHVRLDLPLLADRILRETGQAPFWLGHSFGGQLAAKAANETVPADAVAGLILIATQTERGKRWLVPPLSTAVTTMTRLLGRVPARLAGLGPEDEPAAAVLDSVAWTVDARKTGGWPARLATLETPVLAVASSHDTVDPADGCRHLFDQIGSTDKTWWLLEPGADMPATFDHPGIVVSKPARTHVWPGLAHWMQSRSEPATSVA